MRSRASASPPLVFAAYPVYLGLARGDALRLRPLAGLLEPPPLVRRARSAGSGTGCARAGRASGSSRPARTRTTTGRPVRDTDPMRVAAVNLEALAFLVLLVVLTVIAWRRFGAPYGLFCAVSLAIPLSVPSQPLAAAVAAAVRARALPVLPRARCDRRAAARAHGDPRRQLDHARRRRRPVGAVAMGRLGLVVAAARAPLGNGLRGALRADRHDRAAVSRHGPVGGRPAGRRHRPGPANRRARPGDRGDPARARRRRPHRHARAARTGSTSRRSARARPDLVVASESADLAGPLARGVGHARAGLHRARRLDPPGRAARSRSSACSPERRSRHVRLVRRIEAQRRAVDATARAASGSCPSSSTPASSRPSRTSRWSATCSARRTAGTSPGQRRRARPVDASDLAQLDPDVYLATSDTELTLADMRRNPRTRKLRAIRNGRFVVADAASSQPGPRIGEGLTQVARLLHPDAFR